MSDVTVRPMEAGDLDEVAVFHHRTVLDAYAGLFPPEAPVPTVDGLRDEWAAEPGSAWVAHDGGVVGTVVARGDEVRRLLVDPSRWRRGIGRRLLDVALATMRDGGCEAARLWVLEGNERARRFYEAHRWLLVPDEVLTHRSGVREVRYVRSLSGGDARR